MKFKNAYSVQENLEAMVGELKSQMAGFDPKLLVLFASSQLDIQQLNTEIQKAFPSSGLLGCTTSGEITSGKMLKSSAVLMGISGEVIEDVKLAVVPQLSTGPDVGAALKAFEAHFGKSLQEMDHTEYVGLVLMDGLSGAEEKFMDALGNLTDLSFVGGSAGDDLKFEKTYLFENGKVYENAAVLALIQSKVPFEIIKTQSFCPKDKVLKVTKVNEAGREVLEFNNQPAVEAYAGALSIGSEEVPNHFMSNPVGLVISEEDVYVRSPQRVDGSGIVFYCSIPDGLDVSILQSTDIIKDTQQAIVDAKERLGGLSGIINFNCILRTLELDAEGKSEAYGKLFTDIPTVGFSTYGEAYIGHINQTATMLVFK